MYLYAPAGVVPGVKVPGNAAFAGVRHVPPPFGVPPSTVNNWKGAVVLQTVMRSDNLFITTTLFIIAGLLSSLGAVERVQAMVSGIGFIAVSSRETLEVRLLVLIGIFVFAFFKFTWSLRQFNFTLMLFASAPMPAE